MSVRLSSWGNDMNVLLSVYSICGGCHKYTSVLKPPRNLKFNLLHKDQRRPKQIEVHLLIDTPWLMQEPLARGMQHLFRA